MITRALKTRLECELTLMCEVLSDITTAVAEKSLSPNDERAKELTDIHQRVTEMNRQLLTIQTDTGRVRLNDDQQIFQERVETELESASVLLENITSMTYVSPQIEQNMTWDQWILSTSGIQRQRSPGLDLQANPSGHH